MRKIKKGASEAQVISSNIKFTKVKDNSLHLFPPNFPYFCCNIKFLSFKFYFYFFITSKFYIKYKLIKFFFNKYKYLSKI